MEVSLSSGGRNHSLETVRLLRETVLALRAALERSRKELEELKTHLKNQDHDREAVRETASMDKCGGHEDESGGKLEEEEGEEEGAAEGDQAYGKADSSGESEEIDDIELVFTTEENDPGIIHEDMVPICDDRKPLIETVIVETDISKCGVLEESEKILGSRRNTLPNPLPYRPIVHREILAASRAANTSPPKMKPVGAERKAARKETGAQTDITALPGLWKSETYLAHKISYNLTTLPSKFTLPVPKVSHLPLSDKSREARRILLSDINFTSMVPELSRSADHLHQDEDLLHHQKNNRECMKSCDSGWDGKTLEVCKHGSRSSWGSRCPTPATSIIAEEPPGRHSCRPCCEARHPWSSIPSLGCHHHFNIHHAVPSSEGTARKMKQKSCRHRCCPGGRSLPDLRGDCDSGDSTDSLIDEAEEFLRRSIDNLMSQKVKKPDRIFPETNTQFGFEPPKSAQPFLPMSPSELKQNSLVKVITADARIVMGRVRYSGYVVGKEEPYVGVELANNSGGSDGTFLDHRYFDCKPDHAIFVPFKKIVLAWSM